jgi:hypothetical protein
MKRLLALVISLALTATAAADPSDSSLVASRDADTHNSYLFGALTIGGQRNLAAGAQLEAGRRLGDRDVYLRGQLTHGKNADGGIDQARVGLEARGCAQQILCAFSGLDVGYQHDEAHSSFWFTGDEYGYDAHDAVFVPRAGFEIGNDVKIRAAVEMPFRRRFDSHVDSDTTAGGAGLAASLGAGYAF